MLNVVVTALYAHLMFMTVKNVSQNKYIKIARYAHQTANHVIKHQIVIIARRKELWDPYQKNAYYADKGYKYFLGMMMSLMDIALLKFVHLDQEE